MVLGNCTSTCGGMKLDSSLLAHTKINSKCIQDFNLNPGTPALLRDTEKTPQGASTGKDFCERVLTAQGGTSRTGQWPYMTFKCFLTARETMNRMKRQAPKQVRCLPDTPQMGDDT